MKNKQKLLLVISIILVVLVIIFFIGNSFGFFRYLKKGEIVNVITINGISVEIINKDDDALNLENAYPVSDDEGLNLTPFVFKMTNNSSADIRYQIQIAVDDDKMSNCKNEDGTSCQALTTDYIKFSYKKDDGSYSLPQKLSSVNDTLSSGIISGNQTITSSIIIWIDEEAGNEIMNHYFFGKLIIIGDKAV